jgi:hypothetical protein
MRKPLPSASSAAALVRGEPGALPLVLGHLALRTGLIATGMYVLGGEREHLLRNALAGACAVELFVLGWEYRQRDEP